MLLPIGIFLPLEYGKKIDWKIGLLIGCCISFSIELLQLVLCRGLFEFDDIIQAIEDMDSDVISFEASRSNLTLLDTLNKVKFKSEVGPGVYDIHSPRIPSVEEFESALEAMVEKIPVNKLWVNPDCGLKTRGVLETQSSLENMVTATKNIRLKLQQIKK